MASDITKWLPSPKVRELLASWPAGEVREWSQHDLWRYGEGSTYERCVDRGWLTRTKVQRKPYASATYTVDSYAYTRTDLPAPGYTPRGPQRNYAARNLWPWSVEDHWFRMKSAPARVSTAIANTLEGKPEWQRDMQTRLVLPTFVNTQAELTTLRRILPPAFGHVEAKQARWARWWEEGWAPKSYQALLCSGVGVRLLLLDMLVEPAFDDAGQLVRFTPVDGETALDEAIRVSGAGSTLKDKYLATMRALAQDDTPRKVA